MWEATLNDAVTSYFTHVAGRQLPHLYGDTVLFHQWFLKQSHMYTTGPFLTEPLSNQKHL